MGWYNIYKDKDTSTSQKKRKILIVFDDMIADMLSNKIIELFVHCRKRNISLVSIIQRYFAASKKFKLNSII